MKSKGKNAQKWTSISTGEFIRRYSDYYHIFERSRKQYPGNILHCNYHDLTHNPEKTIAGLLSALGVNSMDGQIINFMRNQSSKHKFHYSNLLSRPIIAKEKNLEKLSYEEINLIYDNLDFVYKKWTIEKINQY